MSDELRLAIIPARGGSKRIPRKNIKLFNGLPIIQYVVKAALESKLFDIVMVSTDDEEIANIAKNAGAEVPFFRTAKLSDDYATTLDVIKEVTNQYATEKKVNYNKVCCIYATAPFVTASKLQEAYNIFEQGFDCVFPVIPFSSPIQRALKFNGNSIKMDQPEHINSRSQDLEKSYHDSGQFYWMDVEKVIEKNRLWTDNSSAIVVNEMEVQDIDTLEDWRIAEFKYRLLNE
jgi:pseudaminic acid cytidylyltransferase